MTCDIDEARELADLIAYEEMWDPRGPTAQEIMAHEESEADFYNDAEKCK